MFSIWTTASPHVDSTSCHTELILNTLGNGGDHLCYLTGFLQRKNKLVSSWQGLVLHLGVRCPSKLGSYPRTDPGRQGHISLHDWISDMAPRPWERHFRVESWQEAYLARRFIYTSKRQREKLQGHVLLSKLSRKREKDVSFLIFNKEN